MAEETKVYKDYKVSELKELLKQRGLSTSGTKTELISRLEDNDTTQDDGAGSDKPQEEEAQPTAEENSEEAAKEPSGEAPAEPISAESNREPEATSSEPQEATKPVSEESITEKALADLETRISRKKKFNESTEDLEIQLKRIKRFGAMAVRDANVKVSKTRARGRSHRGRR